MQKIRKKIADIWGIPESTTMNIPIVTIQGDITISIENYKTVVLYTNEEIRVLSKDILIGVCGKNLKINSIDDKLLIISGIFEKIEYKR